MRLSVLLVPLLLAGCLAKSDLPKPSPSAPPFPVFAFFAGPSRGDARLRILFKGARPVHVVSRGRMEGNMLVLDQTIREGAKPPREREWRIRRTGRDRYAGSLSDAAGPVSGVTTPGTLHLAFAMKDGLQAEQTLVLSPDGQSARNQMVVRKWGLTVAVLDETIRRGNPGGRDRKVGG